MKTAAEKKREQRAKAAGLGRKARQVTVPENRLAEIGEIAQAMCEGKEIFVGKPEPKVEWVEIPVPGPVVVTEKVVRVEVPGPPVVEVQVLKVPVVTQKVVEVAPPWVWWVLSIFAFAAGSLVSFFLSRYLFR